MSSPAPTPAWAGFPPPTAVGKLDRAAGLPRSRAHMQATWGTAGLRASPVVPELPGPERGALLETGSLRTQQMPAGHSLGTGPRLKPEAAPQLSVRSRCPAGLPAFPARQRSSRGWKPSAQVSGPWDPGPASRLALLTLHPARRLTEGFAHISERRQQRETRARPPARGPCARDLLAPTFRPARILTHRHISATMRDGHFIKDT